MSLKGPRRIAVETRYRYGFGEARTFQTYRIRVWLGDTLHRSLAYETGSEYRQPIYVNGSAAILGRGTVR